jgi:hypothetical protein
MLKENESKKQSIDIHNKLVWATIMVFFIDLSKNELKML